MNIRKCLLKENETWRHFIKEWMIFQLKATIYACVVLGILSMLRIIRW